MNEAQRSEESRSTAKLERKWRWVTRRFVLTLKVSSELWFDTRADGTKLVNLFRIGWAERGDSDVKIACFCLLWVSVHFAF